jgi:hypothetical protein
MRRLPAFAALFVAGVFLGWLVFKVSAINALVGMRPRIAASIAPNDPQVMSAAVAMDVRARMGLASPQAVALAREAILRAPLSDDAFLVSGVQRLLKHDNRSAEQLLARALARKPRSRIARLFMLELELRSGNVQGAVSDMTILTRLLPDVEKLFIPELARFARDPQTRPTLERIIRSDPPLFGRLLQHMAAKASNADIVLQLAAKGAPIPEPEQPDWRVILLNTLVDKGDVGRAYQQWRAFLGKDAPDQSNLIYDGSFQGLPGLPPFNWNFTASEMGAAERQKRGGLEVQYYGRTAGDLASQLVVLRPGNYRFSFHAEGDLSDEQHRLVWRMQCTKSNAMVFELPLANITYAGRNVAGNFTVPPKCPAQWLKLVGDPTEFPKIENVVIRSVGIQQRGTAG